MQYGGLILLVFSFVFAMIAAVVAPSFAPRWHLGWLAVAFWILSEIVGGLGRVVH